MTALTLDSALCAQVDPALWFPEKGQSSTAAKKICHDCDIEATCLADALADPELEGVWGGTSHRERQTMRALAGPRVRPIRHGTPGGAKTHRRRGEDPCPACLRAAARAVNERRTLRDRNERAPRLDEITHLLTAGESPENIAQRLHSSLGALAKRAWRAGANDVARQFDRADRAVNPDAYHLKDRRANAAKKQKRESA